MSNIKSFEIRWADLDPNRHVANITYSSLMTERRVSLLREFGIDQNLFATLQVGPIVLMEEFHYIREVMPNETVYVDMELLGNTEDFRFVKIAHTIFNEQGKMAVYGELMWACLDLSARKLTVPPSELVEAFHKIPKAENYAVFSSKETRIKQIPHKEIHVDTL